MYQGMAGLMNGGALALVKSVQHFSIALNGVTSATATINSVTTANSVIFYGGFQESDTTDDPSHFHTGLVLTDATTITASKSNATHNVTITGCVVEFNAGIVKSNQSGIISVASAASATATISSVTTGNAFVVYQGSTYTSATASPETVNGRLALTNATTVTATRQSSNLNTTAVHYTVLEFNSGILNSNTQEIHPQLTTTTTSQDTTITGVTTGATMLVWGGFDQTGTTVHREGNFPTFSLSNTTTVNLSRFDALNNTVTATATVVEFKTGSIKSLQRGSNQIAGSGTSANNTISAVTTAKTALNYCGQTFQKGSANADASSCYGNIALTSTTNIAGTRTGADASGLNTGWEAIEFI